MHSSDLEFGETGDLIRRFLENRPSYLQEWNDFVEIRQRMASVELIRKRCYELDPLVNRPGIPNEDAVAELTFISQLCAALAKPS